MAIDTGFKDIDLLNTVCNYMKVGANAQENLEQPPLQLMLPHHITKVQKVRGAICEWLDHGYAIGPLERHEIPFDDIKISGLMTKIKPNGRVRVILNLSLSMGN